MKYNINGKDETCKTDIYVYHCKHEADTFFACLYCRLFIAASTKKIYSLTKSAESGNTKKCGDGWDR